MGRVVGTLLIVLVAACTTLPPPSASPTLATPPSPSATTTEPSASPSAPRDGGLPDEIRGMPVLTVEAASRLLLDGELNGRAVAVAGYWAQSVIDCPYSPHVPVIVGDCWYVAFTDEPLDGAYPYETQQGPGVIEPMILPESANQDLIWPNMSKPLILIGHAGDPRLWQCDPDWREHCAQRFVVDSVAWAGARATPGVGTSDDAVITRHRVPAAEAMQIDPRLAGVRDLGDVWVERVVGELGADGASELSVRAIDASSGATVASLPAATPPDYAPARVTVDSRLARRGVPTNNRDWRYAVETSDGRVLATGRLGGLTPPLPLLPGDSVLRAWTVDNRDGSLVGRSCTLAVALEARADRYFRATFGRRTCSWTEADDLYDLIGS